VETRFAIVHRAILLDPPAAQRSPLDRDQLSATFTAQRFHQELVMAEDQPKQRAVVPRDQGGSIELKEGTGGILATCPCDDFLEIYKKDVTFRLETPETIDPARTNPNAPMVAAVSDRIGCADPVIARVLLQGRDIIESAFLVAPVDKQGVVRSPTQ
jgi:hypothetical protein